jgi:large subunit ribosomal protein L21
MYAVIETGGKQYRVSPGDTIEVEKLPAEAGADVELGRVLAVYNDDHRLLTGPEVASAKVTATLEEQGRAEKVIVFKFKRKKQYKRTIGHRQYFSRLRIKEIIV